MRLLLLAVLLVTGCDSNGSTSPSAENAAFEAAIDATGRALDIVIGDRKASTASACRRLALTRDSCGNTSTFRIYSAESDTVAIRQLAEEYRRLSEEYDDALGVVRQCRVFELPEVIYEEGRCASAAVLIVD